MKRGAQLYMTEIYQQALYKISYTSKILTLLLLHMISFVTYVNYQTANNPAICISLDGRATCVYALRNSGM